MAVVTSKDVFDYIREQKNKIGKRLDKDNSLLEKTGEFATSDKVWFKLLKEYDILTFIENKLLNATTVTNDEARKALDTIWYAKQECSSDCSNMCDQCQKMEAKQILVNALEEQNQTQEIIKNIANNITHESMGFINNKQSWVIAFKLDDEQHKQFRKAAEKYVKK